MKRYHVVKVYDDHDEDCGLLPESDVKSMTKGYTYDELGFYGRKNGKYIIVVEEEK